MSAWKLEVNMSEHLDGSGIAAVELVESPEQRIAGNQVVARASKTTHGNIVNDAASPLRMIEKVIHLGANIEGVALREIEPLFYRKVDVVDGMKRKRIASAVRQCARTAHDIARVLIVGYVSHD